MTKRTYSHTNSGTPSTDDGVESLPDEAERGYDVEEIIGRRGKRGRPRLGSAPSTVEAVRLDPELKAQLNRPRRASVRGDTRSTPEPSANRSLAGALGDLDAKDYSEVLAANRICPLAATSGAR